MKQNMPPGSRDWTMISEAYDIIEPATAFDCLVYDINDLSQF